MRSHGCIDQVHFAYHHHQSPPTTGEQSPSSLFIIYLLSSLVLAHSRTRISLTAPSDSEILRFTTRSLRPRASFEALFETQQENKNKQKNRTPLSEIFPGTLILFFRAFTRTMNETTSQHGIRQSSRALLIPPDSTEASPFLFPS